MRNIATGRLKQPLIIFLGEEFQYWAIVITIGGSWRQAAGRYSIAERLVTDMCRVLLQSAQSYN